MRNKHLLGFAFLALTLAIPACGPAPMTAPAPVRPPETPPMAVIVDDAAATGATRDRTAVKLESQVQAISERAASLRDGISEATREADRLRQQKTATEKELVALWAMLTNEQKHARVLFEESERNQALADQHRRERETAESQLVRLADVSRKAEIELKALRANHDAMAGQIDQARKTEASLQGRLEKAQEQAAVARFIKGAAAIAIGSLVIAAVAIAALKILM